MGRAGDAGQRQLVRRRENPGKASFFVDDGHRLARAGWGDRIERRAQELRRICRRHLIAVARKQQPHHGGHFRIR